MHGAHRSPGPLQWQHRKYPGPRPTVPAGTKGPPRRPRVSGPPGRGCSAPRCRSRAEEESRVGWPDWVLALRSPPCPTTPTPHACPREARLRSCGAGADLLAKGNPDPAGVAGRKVVPVPFSCIPAGYPCTGVTRKGLGSVENSIFGLLGFLIFHSELKLCHIYWKDCKLALL